MNNRKSVVFIVEHSCPSCGAPIRFRNKAIIESICGHCRTIAVRTDTNLLTYGKMAELPEDMSPLQLGTSGKYEGRDFWVLGRIKQVWEEGFWNEWYIQFGSGESGWLSDAQGHYIVTEERPVPSFIKEVSQLNFKDQYLLAGGKDRYELVDKKEARCLSAEGELPFKVTAARAVVLADFATYDGKFATLDFEEGVPRLYLGKVVPMAALALQNLRTWENWPKPRR